MERYIAKLETKLIIDQVYVKKAVKDINTLCFRLAEEKNDDFLEKIVEEEPIDKIYEQLLFYCLYNDLVKSTKALLYKTNYTEMNKLLFVACKNNLDQIAKVILIRSDDLKSLIESEKYNILYHIYKNNMKLTKSHLQEQKLDYSKSPQLLEYYLEQKDEKNIIEIIINNNLDLNDKNIKKILENKMPNVLVETNKHTKNIWTQLKYLENLVNYWYKIGAEKIIKDMIINDFTEEICRELNDILMDSIRKKMDSIACIIIQKICKNNFESKINIGDNIIKVLYENKMIETIRELIKHDIQLKKNLNYAVKLNEIKISHEIVEKMSTRTLTDEIDDEMNMIFILALENKNEIVSKALIRQNLCDLTYINSKNETAILIACKNDLKETALEILEKKFVTSKNIDGYDELMYASYNGMTDVVTRLISLECCNSYCNYKGETALSIACRRNNSKIAEEIMDSRKFDPSVVDEAFGNTALMYACAARLEIVALRLLETGNSKPEHSNKYGETALMIASSRGLENLSNKLIKTIISNPSAIINEDNSILINACKTKMISTALLLLETKNCHAKYNKKKETALMYACFNSMNDVCMRLIETKNCDHTHCINDYWNDFRIKGVTALKLACRNEKIMPEVIYGILDLYNEQPAKENTSNRLKIRNDEVDYILEWAKKTKKTDIIEKKYNIYESYKKKIENIW
jgi:FOG: Ankyrin repeat